ncbi:MAG: flavin reductase family protein [Bacteroidetes bacterium]|nr:flavin reductase family protein [Bacteroidota bacterium]
MLFDFSKLSPADRQYYLHNAVAPRPICFASTIDQKGNVNLSPFSFFNVFSSNPPIVIFSPARRIRDNSVKHTLENVSAVPEVAINIVTLDMVQQQSLASCEFPKEVNEFEKAGFTATPATRINPPLVKESKIQLECAVIEVKPLGNERGAGNLVICEVLCMHINDTLLDENKKMDPRHLPLVGRLGEDWYTVVNEQNLFQVPKPNTSLGMGIDSLPSAIRTSQILTGNDLGQLANFASIPPLDPAFQDPHLKQIVHYFSVNPDQMELEIHRYASQLLSKGEAGTAWQVLLYSVVS